MVNQDDCFERLEQLVLDENKQVTYKALSRELKIHVNEAKQHLYDFFIQQLTVEKTTLQASYFLAGFLEDNGVKTTKLLITTQNHLEKEKAKLTEVTSCHIYSVSKDTPNNCALSRADQCYNQNIEDQNKYSAIRHIRIKSQPPVLNKVNVSKNDSKPTVVKNEFPKTLKNGTTSVQVVKEKDEKKLATSSVTKQEKEETETNGQAKKPILESKPQKANPLASMWQKNEEKSSAKSETNKPESKGKNKSPQETKKVQKNNILSMFSKQAEKNAGNPPKKTPPSANSFPKKTTESISPKKEQVSPKLEEVENRKSTKATVKKGKSNQSSKRAKASKKKDGSESEEDFQPKKKHRRIRAYQESDSESECEEEKDKAQRSLWLPEEPMETSEPIEPATPASDDSEEPIPPTPPVIPQNKGKKKIWKNVQKTYQDEDGFFVTKQEKVLATESESDEDPIPEKVTPKKDVKANAFTYRKQASLTSFFKQK